MRSRDTRAEAALLLAAALAVVLPAAATAQPSPGPADLPRGLGDLTARHDGFRAVPAARLRGQGVSSLLVEGHRLVAELGGQRLEMAAGSPFYRYGGTVSQLSNAPYRRDGSFWIPAELLQRLRERGEATETAAARAGRAGRRSGAGRSESRTRPWTVTIDPGHGGRDPGARGPRGTREKNVVLEIAWRVRQRLAEAEQVEVHLTRSDDRFIPLAERTKIALRDSADLFVSIHANANRSRRPRGFETYYLGEARSEEARRVAMRENSVIKYEERDERPEVEAVNYIWASIDQNTNVQESSYFAGRVQNELRGNLDTQDRGAKPGPYYVLMGASGSMPAVLVETGFLSNPVEEEMLTSASGQRRIADAIAEAILSYFRQRDGRLAAGSRS